MSVRLITPPVSYPVTLDEVKLRCKIDGTDRDNELSGLIAAATNYVEQYTGRVLVQQTWEQVLDDFSDPILLEKNPVTAITSVKYFDANEVEQTVSSNDYVLDAVSDPQWLVFASDFSAPTVAPGVNNVTIRFVAGYSAIPDAIKWAILLWIEAMVDGKEVPNAFDHLLVNYRDFV